MPARRAEGLDTYHSLDARRLLGHSFRGIICKATGIQLEIDWEVWRQNRFYQWADDSRLQDLPRRQGEESSQGKSDKEAQVFNPPRLSTCSWDDCSRAGVRGGRCAKCRMHLCALHLFEQYHICPSTQELSDAVWDKSITERSRRTPLPH
ncbi:hypothetical protein BDV06DRAFT_187590 [Aspergillus oleicola]